MESVRARKKNKSCITRKRQNESNWFVHWFTASTDDKCSVGNYENILFFFFLLLRTGEEETV